MPSDINVLLVILGITVSAEGAPGAIEKPVPGAEVEGVVPGGEVPEVVECTTLTADTAVQWKLDPDTLQLSLSWPNFSCSFTVYGGPPGATSTAIDVVEVTDYTLTYTNGWLYTIQGNEPNSRTGTILQTEWIDPSTALTVVEGTPRAAVATLTPVPPLGEVPGAPIVKGQGVTMKKIFFVGLSLLVSLAAAWGSFSIFSTEGGVDFKQKLLGAFAMELVVVCWILVPVNFSVLSITPSGIMPLNFGKGIIAVVAAGITIAAMLYLHIKMQKQDIEPRELLPWAFCIFSVMTLVQVIAMLMIGFIQT